MAIEILIADDDPVVQHILGTILDASSYDTSLTFAKNGGECLRILSEFVQANNVPKLLFLDYLLPDISGAEVLKNIRDELKLDSSALPVVLLSANTEADLAGFGVDLCPEKYLGKPFVAKDVYGVLKDVLGGL